MPLLWLLLSGSILVAIIFKCPNHDGVPILLPVTTLPGEMPVCVPILHIVSLCAYSPRDTYDQFATQPGFRITSVARLALAHIQVELIFHLHHRLGPIFERFHPASFTIG